MFPTTRTLVNYPIHVFVERVCDPSMSQSFLALVFEFFSLFTGWCLLSQEKAVEDVNSRVGFCFLVGF